MSSEADKIAQFQSLTGATEPIARSILEAANWDLEAAAETFFDPVDMPDVQPTVEDDDGDEEWTPFGAQPPPAPASSSSHRPVRAPPSNRFASLSDFNRSNDDDDDDEGRQNMFAGGEKSGLSIQNPNVPTSAQDEVRNIINRAMQQSIPPTPQQQSSHNQSFQGTGFTLGSDSMPSQPVPTTMPPGSRPGAVVHRVLTLWRNGFTIDNGPLFSFTDPESSEILREIRMGRVPRNVAGVQMGENVEMKVEKRINEDWTPAPSSSRPGGTFLGHGNRLGSAIPGEPVIPPPPAPTSSTTESKPAQPTPEIDPSLPQTTIQLRLADGTRLVTQFNLSSTMNDVYSFVGRARPTQGREFVLQTIFPTRVLEKGHKTIEQEGLKSGTIVMRWKA